MKESNQVNQLKRKRFKIKSSPPDVVFDVIKIVVLVVSIVLVILPILNIVALSLSNGYRNPQVTIIPLGFTFASYGHVLSELAFLQAFGNSVLATVVVTIASNLFMSMAAYPLSKSDCPFKKGITTVFIVTMLFSAGIVPSYLLMIALHLTNNIWSVILISINNVYVSCSISPTSSGSRRRSKRRRRSTGRTVFSSFSSLLFRSAYRYLRAACSSRSWELGTATAPR